MWDWCGGGGALPAAYQADTDGEGQGDEAGGDRGGFEVEQAQGGDHAQPTLQGACRAEQAAAGGGRERGDREGGDSGRPQDACQASGAQESGAVVGEDERERHEERGQ